MNNQREHYEFRFNGTLGAEAKQDEVQSGVAFALTVFTACIGVSMCVGVSTGL